MKTMFVVKLSVLHFAYKNARYLVAADCRKVAGIAV